MMWLMALLASGNLVPPEPIRPSGWIGPYDYPRKSLQEDEQGYTVFRLTISPTGTPERCDIILSSGFKVLDDETCRLLMKRARFRPAQDGLDNPVFGTFKSNNAWLIPEAGRVQPPTMADFALIVNRLPNGSSKPVEIKVGILVSEKGIIEKCDLEAPKADPALGKIACEQTLLSWLPEPALTKEGIAVRSVQTVRILFDIAQAED